MSFRLLELIRVVIRIRRIQPLGRPCRSLEAIMGYSAIPKHADALRANLDEGSVFQWNLRSAAKAASPARNACIGTRYLMGFRPQQASPSWPGSGSSIPLPEGDPENDLRKSFARHSDTSVHATCPMKQVGESGKQWSSTPSTRPSRSSRAPATGRAACGSGVFHCHRLGPGPHLACAQAQQARISGPMGREGMSLQTATQVHLAPPARRISAKSTYGLGPPR